MNPSDAHPAQAHSHKDNSQNRAPKKPNRQTSPSAPVDLNGNSRSPNGTAPKNEYARRHEQSKNGYAGEKRYRHGVDPFPCPRAQDSKQHGQRTSSSHE